MPRETFGQAKQIALNTTNRKQNNIIPEILLRLQMKQQEGKLRSSITPQQSKVSTVAKQVPEYQGTMVPIEFLRKGAAGRHHLERLSSYLCYLVGSERRSILQEIQHSGKKAHNYFTTKVQH